MIDKRNPKVVQQEVAETAANPKRQQILNGARDVFRAHGFDGASMDQIARSAGVSKGTLYVYFDNKTELFRALIREERHDQAESIFDLEDSCDSMRDLLLSIAHAYVRKMMDPRKLSTVRMVIGATEQFPEFGALLFEAGPEKGCERLGRMFEQKRDEGLLTCTDPVHSARQFIDLCGAWALKRVLFNPGQVIPQDEIDRNIMSAVDVFMAAYSTEK